MDYNTFTTRFSQPTGTGKPKESRYARDKHNFKWVTLKIKRQDYDKIKEYASALGLSFAAVLKSSVLKESILFFNDKQQKRRNQL